MTRPTNLGKPLPRISLAALGDSTSSSGGGSGAAGTVLTSTGSNGGTYWGENVARISANGSNPILGPFVSLAAGSNMILTIDQGPAASTPSNTIRFHASLAGGSTSITANSSNSISPVNLVSGTDILFAATGSSLTISRAGPTRATLLFVIDGGGSAITTGVKGDLMVDFDGVIEQWSLLPDQSGSIVVDVWKDTYGNFPPVVGDSITASAKPTLTSTTKAQSGVLTGWTTSFSAGDTFRINVDSITTCTRVTLALRVRRNPLA